MTKDTTIITSFFCLFLSKKKGVNDFVRKYATDVKINPIITKIAIISPIG